LKKGCIMSLPKRARPLIFKYALFKAFILSTGVLCPAFADDTNTTVGDLSARLDDLERQVNEGGGKVDEASPGSQVTADDLNRLKEEVRSLKGESDDMRSLRDEMRSLREEIKHLKEANSDLRTQKTSRKMSSSDDADEDTVPKRKDETLKQTKKSSPEKSFAETDDEADAVLKLLEKSAPGADQEGSQEFGTKKGKKNKDLEADRESATKHAEETAPTLPAGDAEAQYNEAFALHDKGAYKESERAFGYFIKTYPNDPLVPKAMYWKAESCLKQKNYKDAKILFVNAYKKNPKGPKAPDCLLRLGEILAIQGKKDDARTAWRKLKTDFPHMTSEMKEELASLQKTHGTDQKSVKSQKLAPSE
jgi:tol-pal system protein YbgF